jgi:Mitochondria-eating protein
VEVSNAPKRPILPPPSEPPNARLVMKYESLYAQAKVDTLDALDILDELKGAEELKSKILFSVVVVSFHLLNLLLYRFIEIIENF